MRYPNRTCIDCGDVIATGNRCAPDQLKYNDRYYARKAHYADKAYRAYVVQGLCEICHASVATQRDHIVSLNNMGTNEYSNLRSVCASCNASKGATIDKQ